MKNFSDLTEQEVLALAITNEEEDSRIYRGFSEGLRDQFPSSAKVFDEMADEEVTHRTRLFDLYQVPGIAETVSLEQIKRHYYWSQKQVNPTGIVPVGPQLDFAAPHDRARFG